MLRRQTDERYVMQTTATPEPIRNETRQEYRNCVLVIEPKDQSFESSVFVGELSLGRCHSDRFEDCVQTLRSLVDTYYEERMVQRGSVVPSDVEYVTAMQEISQWLTPVQKKLLATHLLADDYRCTVDFLLERSAVHSTIRLLLVYANIARRLSDALAYIPALNGSVIDPIVAVLMTSTGILSTKRGEPRTLQLQADVGNALDKMNGHRPTENFS